MTRVSSFGQNQALLQGILNNQVKLFEAQKQVNTGKQSDEYRGIADEAVSLVASKSLKSRTDAYQEVAREVGRTADTYDIQLELFMDGARELRQQLLTYIANNDGTGFDIVLSETFSLMKDALNTKVGNRYIFGGAAASEAPITAQNLDELQAAAAVGDIFVNDQLKANARVSDNISVEYGILADETATDIFQVIRDLADFNDGPLGPVDGPMDAVQVDFLRTQLGALDAATQEVQKKQMLNGLNQSKLEDLVVRHEDQKVFLETFIADIEDVDITEAISRLNNTQTVLQASYRVVAQTTQLSIVDFI